MSYAASMVHAPLSTINSVICTWFICGEGQNFFNSFECANTVLYAHLWGLNLSAAYLWVDFWMLIYYCGWKTSLEKQNLVHHWLSYFFMYLT